jgi:catechol 2,3-dioxygenase-like lactoylglutathione lyase family enzyme
LLVYDHIGLAVSDLGRSATFYETALAPLGLNLTSRDDSSAGFGSPDATILWLTSGRPVPDHGVHIAFAASDEESVEAFHAAALAAGGADNGAPGPRPDYGEHYYAAYALDPDGNNIEAVYTG